MSRSHFLVIFVTIYLIFSWMLWCQSNQCIYGIVHWTIKEEDKSSSLVECNFENHIFGEPVNQEDPCLVAAVRTKLLIPPPKNAKRVPLSKTADIPTNNEKFEWVNKLLVEKLGIKKGFFVELGANDGSFISPTLRLEKELNWTGLLIEAVPSLFQTLLTKRRNVWAINAAASVNPHPKQCSFSFNSINTGSSSFKERHHPGWGEPTNITVQCIPLYTILKALDVVELDYLSLDVEGAELDILKTLPWEKISFKLMTIEHWSVPRGLGALESYLKTKGYKLVKTLTDRDTRDGLYVKESLYEQAKGLL